jgi:hypothetical protein
VRHDDDILTQKYNIKKFPTIIVVKANENKPKVYTGEMKFSPIFDFLNVYSGTDLQVKSRDIYIYIYIYKQYCRGFRTRWFRFLGSCLTKELVDGDSARASPSFSK